MKLLALGLLLGLSAFGQKIQVEADRDANFSGYRTFAIRQARLNSRNPALNSDLVRKRLDGDIRRALEKKGLTFVPEGRADLQVRYTLGAARRVQRELYPAGWRGLGTRVVRVPYTEGTLVLDLRDPATRSLVWRAIARQDKPDASRLEGKLDDMVRKSFDKYPPKLK